MKLGQTDAILAHSNLLSDGQTESETPCERLKAGDNLSLIDKATAWIKANKGWLPWAGAAGAGLYLLGRSGK